MISNFKIDQGATFQGIAFLSCVPKTGFRSDVQEVTKGGLNAGTPKWVVEVIAQTQDQFGRPQNQVLKVTIASHRNPAEGMNPYTPVGMVDFEIGVMESKKKNPDTGEEKIVGVTIWYRAAAIKALAAAK
jgi:hypothetical protein